MGSDADYSPNIMRQAVYFLSRERIVSEDVLSKFEKFVSHVNSVVEKEEANVEKVDEMEVEGIKWVLMRKKNCLVEKIFIENLSEFFFTLMGNIFYGEFVTWVTHPRKHPNWRVLFFLLTNSPQKIFLLIVTNSHFKTSFSLFFQIFLILNSNQSTLQP